MSPRRAPSPFVVMTSALLLASAVGCSETAPRGDGDASVRIDSTVPPPPTPPPDPGCEPIACGPIPDGCEPTPPTVPCGCAGYVCPDDCRNTCPPPPSGCYYPPDRPTEAPCGQPLSCEPVCMPDCAIACPAPPPGCHYEGAILDGPCDSLTCGTVVCDDPPSDPACPGGRGAGECCARTTRVDPSRIALRVVGIDIEAPAALANATIISLLQGAVDGERLNWLVSLITESSGASGIATADGVRTPDGSFAPSGEIVLMGATSGSWLSETASERLSLAILNEDGSLLMTLPIDALRFDGLPLTDDLACVGARAGRRWITPGRYTGVITVAAAREARIEALGMDLCALLAGTSCDMPESTWRNRPDVPCAEGTECSGWTLTGSLAAAATPSSL